MGAVLAVSAGLSSSSSSSWSKTCARCGRTYDAAPWDSLELVLTVPQSGVQQHLTVPAPWRVEVRRCACGAMLAARG
jgi:hypothetical protein